ncbi:MAG: hypothetical protein IKW90_15730 [Lachnospiraceae bacterium]|nr:hypothetical protein [Lachnospiraceae bacterium]
MYNLSEQPISKILEEMTDFTPLKKTAIFTVKEKFDLNDTVYEIGDHVAICSLDDTTIYIMPYEELKKYKSAQFNKALSLNKTSMFTSIDQFKERFELSEIETEKVVTIQDEIQGIENLYNKQISSVLTDHYCSEAQILILSFGTLMALVLLAWSICDPSLLAIIPCIIIGAIVIIEWYDFLSKSKRIKKVEEAQSAAFDALDNQRSENGMLVK